MSRFEAQPGATSVRTYGKTSLRNFGATTILGLMGTTAALIPIAVFSLFNNHAEPHWSLYAGASIVGGAVIGWVVRR